MENVLELVVTTVYNTEYTTNHLTVYFKMVHFMLYELLLTVKIAEKNITLSYNPLSYIRFGLNNISNFSESCMNQISANCFKYIKKVCWAP